MESTTRRAISTHQDEEWRPIPYSTYEASSLGRIRNCKTQKVQEPQVGDDQYLFVGIRFLDQKHSKKVHQLVCMAFHGLKPMGAECVRHLDGDRNNNRPENLRSGLITPCGTGLENLTRTGAVASPLIVKRSTRAKSGSRHAAKRGSATRRHASGADLFTTQTLEFRFTSITSHPSRSKSCEQMHRTCCLFANLATNGFIQEGM